MLTKLVNMVLF